MARSARRSGTARARRIVANPRIFGGKPVIEGTRMSVEQILGLLAKGMTPERIVKSFPQLTVADVLGVVAYAQKALRDDYVCVVTR